MKDEWSKLNKIFQNSLTKKDFSINPLLYLRQILYNEILSFKNKLCLDDFSKCPFINHKGYESKTVAYSIWHIARIEDIVVNSLILNREEIFFQKDFKKIINTPIITTGNELFKDEIVNFSKELNINELYNYIDIVYNSTNEYIYSLKFEELKRKFSEEDKKRLISLNVVSNDENAVWLIDYWCEKDIKGLLKMPFSRHWIMHIEASNRIINKITIN